MASYYVGSQSEFDAFMATFAPAFDALAPPTDREPGDEDSEVACVAVYPGWGRCPALDTEGWVGPALHRVLCIRHRQVVDPKFGTRVGEPGAELLRPDQLTPRWRPLSGGDGFGMNPGVWTCEPEATP